VTEQNLAPASALAQDSDEDRKSGDDQAASAAVLDLEAEEPLVESDLLVEDVSIDGMCGVY
jgi:mycofactocin precursor